MNKASTTRRACKKPTRELLLKVMPVPTSSQHCVFDFVDASALHTASSRSNNYNGLGDVLNSSLTRGVSIETKCKYQVSDDRITANSLGDASGSCTGVVMYQVYSNTVSKVLDEVATTLSFSKEDLVVSKDVGRNWYMETDRKSRPNLYFVHSLRYRSFDVSLTRTALVQE